MGKIKKTILITLLVLCIFILNGCIQQEQHKEQPLTFTQENTLQKEQQELGLLKLEKQQLQEQLKKQEKELAKYKATQLKDQIDLTSWTEDEIIESFKPLNEKFKNISWFEYRYDHDNSYYYDIEGPIIKDPFHKFAYDDENREWSVDKLRIFDLGYDNLSLAEKRYTDYREMVLKQTRIDKEIICYEQIGCRDIKFISCKKSKNNYYSWFAERYLFVTRDDNGDAFKTFKELYCTSEDKGFIGITAGIVKDLDLKSREVVNFFKKLI